MSDSVARQKIAARTAGIALLLVLLTGIFAQFFVFLRLPAGDAATTARNILAHETLFRLGIGSAIVSGICGLVEIWALYELLQPFRGALALLALLVQFTGSVLMLATIHSDFLALHLARAGASLAPGARSGLVAAAQSLLTHPDGLHISIILSSCGAGVFAWLLFRSRYIPRPISAFMFFADAFTVVSIFVMLIAPGVGAVLFPWFPLSQFLAMLLLALWLAIKGATIYPQTVAA